MGIYDREYYRDDEAGSWANRPMVTNVIIVTGIVYLADVLLGRALTGGFALSLDVFSQPWKFYQFLTYGFIHDTQPSLRAVFHVLFNMYALWLFGREVENLYGRAEFLRVYLALIVLSGLAWAIVERATGSQVGQLVGASGAVTGIMIIYVLHNPRQTFLFFGVLPLQAWALAAIIIFQDVAGALQREPSGNVAYVAHLAGAGLGFLYYWSGFKLGSLVPRRWSFRFRPKLKLHDPEQAQKDLSRQVDQILEKISREGEGSLTKKERRILEEASRRYQRRRS